MAKGKSKIVASSNVRKLTISIELDNLNKPAENMGILATVNNAVNDELRRHFSAHQIKSVIFKEPRLPKRLRVRKKK